MGSIFFTASHIRKTSTSSFAAFAIYSAKLSIEFELSFIFKSYSALTAENGLAPKTSLIFPFKTEPAQVNTGKSVLEFLTD